MTWYYKDQDKAHGPFTQTELQALINKKTINAATLVRRESEDDWRPLAAFAKSKAQTQAQESAAASAGGMPPATEAAPAQKAAASETAGETCSQCGKPFPPDQLVFFDGKAICAGCKPAFVQRIKEGAGIDTAMRYAGFWIRFGAKIIDGIILLLVQWAILIPLNLLTLDPAMMKPGQMSPGDPSFFIYLGIQQLVGIAVPAIYTTFFLGRFAATPGKMVCGLQVVAPDGGRISYLRALGRNFAEILSAIILMVGYIMAGFDAQKRALHDRICSTRVVYK